MYSIAVPWWLYTFFVLSVGLALIALGCALLTRVERIPLKRRTLALIVLAGAIGLVAAAASGWVIHLLKVGA
ncbi:MAG: hypothetical protein HYX47_10315 [Burkholderiales bacterium]|nr:hypothetical protein [Burkholderiales bacterium]